ncbi:TonB C-terminal domain-containing protein [Alphaproteobacteria bacterium]|nr:TonB C-terminal domain-containing protein [Alphaproteobacteria bacterium]
MTRGPIIISVMMHFLIAILAIVGLPSLSRDLPEDMPLVVMEMVQTVPETNLIEGKKPSTAKEAQEPKVQKKKQPAPPPKPPAPKPAPAPRPTETAKAEPEPEPASKKPDIAAEVIPEKPVVKPKLSTTQAVVAAKPRKPTPPKSLPKPKPKRPKQAKPAAKPAPPAPKPSIAKGTSNKKTQDDPLAQVNKLVNDEQKRQQAATGVLQNLAKAKVQADEAEKKRQEQERKEASDKLTQNLAAAAGNAQKAPKPPRDMSIGVDIIDRVRLHLRNYWSPPPGAAGNDTLIVDIIVEIDGQSNVVRAEIKDKLRMSLDKYFKVSAQAAQRAMVDASPLPIPHQADGKSREFIFEFDPAFMSR